MAQQPRAGQGDNTVNKRQFERTEGRRAILLILMAIVVILVLGFLAGLVDDLIRTSVDENVFLTNSREILQVIGSSAPWIAFFIILCSSWVVLADRLFVRWNRVLGHEDDKDKGIIYEIVHDNNAAAAMMLLLPMLLIAMGLIYVALLNLPYNIPIVTTPTTR